MHPDARFRDLERIVTATRDFCPQRLTLAREMAGLDLKELAERIETTSSAVSQFEKGKARPRSETVIRLALALGVPPEFLSARELPRIPLEYCHFRSLRSAPVKERRRVMAHGAIVAALADHLREFVNFPEEQIADLCSQWKQLDDVEDLAIAVRDAWHLGFGPVSNMVGLLESKGVLPVEVPGHSSALDAFSVWAQGRPIIFLVQAKSSGSRRRFDAAHELGHLIMHRDTPVGSASAEREADAFASAFLLPREPFISECPRRLVWPRLRELKRRWGVSLAAIVRRAYDLGLISEPTYRRAYVYLNQSGWRTNEPDEPAMEYPSLLQRAVGLLEAAGYSLSQLAHETNLGEAFLQRLLRPPRAEQGLLSV